MSNHTGDKVHLNISCDFWFKGALKLLAEKKGITVSELLQETIIAKHPEILETRTKIVRRIL